jgi:hypothetical protein
MKLRNVRIESLREAYFQITQELKFVIMQEQMVCEHLELAETPWKDSTYGNATPERRICLQCGMAEVGWGPGFIVLGPQRQQRVNAPQTIDEKTFYWLRQGLFITNELKGPLIRKEKTVAQLVREYFEKKVS